MRRKEPPQTYKVKEQQQRNEQRKNKEKTLDSLQERQESKVKGSLGSFRSFLFTTPPNNEINNKTSNKCYSTIHYDGETVTESQAETVDCT